MREGAAHDKTQEPAVAAKRTLSGPIAKIALAVAVFGTIYHLYSAGFGSQSQLQLRSMHWAFISFLAFLFYPARKGSPRGRISVFDGLLALAALSGGLYIYFTWMDIADRMGFTIPRDIYFGVMTVLLVLEACRRIVGIPLMILAGVFLVYGFLGPHLPLVLAHKGYGLEAMVRVLYISTDGIFGLPISISASYVVLFILFGAFLQASGGGKLFTDVAFALVGGSYGGPAKAAVVSSSLMGMLSGAAVANVVTTGTFTIPLMKKSGYSRDMAGAIEAVASTGGQFVPPVMGAAAFMIAEIVGIPYGKVALAAVIPSVLYYSYLYLCVDLEAKKAGMTVVFDKKELPSLKEAMRERGHLLLPLIVLIYLLVAGYSPGKSIFWCIVLVVAVSYLRKSTRMSLHDLLGAMENGIKNAVPVAVACAAAGIITGVISLTGLGLRFSSILIGLAGSSVFLMLIITMVASIILGMGLPTSAAYIILAILTAPAMINLGVDPLCAHFFIFFFGCISTITPPVALSAYAAAGISEGDPMKTGFIAFRLGLMGFIIPFIAVYQPAILLKTDWGMVILITVLSLIAIFALTYGSVGFRNGRLGFWERTLFFFAAAAIIVKFDLIVSVISIVMLVLLFYKTRARE